MVEDFSLSDLFGGIGQTAYFKNDDIAQGETGGLKSELNLKSIKFDLGKLYFGDVDHFASHCDEVTI